jgi:lipopolysaccharide/colanic/teichoic acid biosynthesis glycosyltransferase
MMAGGTTASIATFRPSITPATIRFLAQEAVRPKERTGREHALRALNVAVAAVALVLAAPLMLVIAVAVKLTSRGPVIYRQPRVGLDRRKGRGAEALNHRRKSDFGGRIFTIYKFRTMRQTGDTSRQVWASKDDPRITPVGRVLRAFRFDELPQLFNVLKGDMNIVGPRPEQPAIFANLSEELSHYRRRQKVLPGITGLAQITLPYDQDLNTVRNKVDLDLEYIRRRSVAHDLMIMAKTMPVMVMRKGSM